jgi:hypothetical protein
MRKSFKEVKDLFGDLLGKPFKVTVGGKTLDLSIRMEDIHSFMTLESSEDKGLSKEDALQITETLRQILYRSYIPYWTPETDMPLTNLSDMEKQENEDTKNMLEAFLIRNFIQLFIEVGIALGWGERSALEKQAEKMSKNGTSPTQLNEN